MTAKPDPYRVLGLQPGASLNEIRSAYRRLAKLHHPDAGGERSLPRFLSIQAAYEALAADGGARPDRARATREGGRARRTGSARAQGPESGGAASGGPGPRPGPRPGPAGGGSAPRSAQGPAFVRKAAPGSTSYDEAAATPFEPPWDGGDWYGASMGTYWTLNPREYADPRKHGPEYEARARRTRKRAAGGDDGSPAP
jgi:curved DNA-binding protein CbpA